MALALTTLGTLAVLGRATIVPILALTVVIGCARALQQVTQQVHTHDLVGAPRLTEALGLLGIAMRIGGLTGALLAGRLIGGLGPGVAYLAAAAACAPRNPDPPPALVARGAPAHGIRLGVGGPGGLSRSRPGASGACRCSWR